MIFYSCCTGESKGPSPALAHRRQLLRQVPVATLWALREKSETSYSLLPGLFDESITLSEVDCQTAHSMDGHPLHITKEHCLSTHHLSAVWHEMLCAI